jgi:hypothetical protein
MKPEDLVYNKKYYLQTSRKSEIVTYAGKQENLYIFQIYLNITLMDVQIIGNPDSVTAKFYFPEAVVKSKIIDFDEALNSFEQLNDIL